MIHFRVSFPMVLSLDYLIARSLKAYWYWTKSTLFEGFRPFLGLAYVVTFPISSKIEDIVPVLHMELCGTEFETEIAG